MHYAIRMQGDRAQILTDIIQSWLYISSYITLFGQIEHWNCHQTAGLIAIISKIRKYLAEKWMCAVHTVHTMRSALHLSNEWETPNIQTQKIRRRNWYFTRAATNIMPGNPVPHKMTNNHNSFAANWFFLFHVVSCGHKQTSNLKRMRSK